MLSCSSIVLVFGGLCPSYATELWHYFAFNSLVVSRLLRIYQSRLKTDSIGLWNNTIMCKRGCRKGCRQERKKHHFGSVHTVIGLSRQLPNCTQNESQLSSIAGTQSSKKPKLYYCCVCQISSQHLGCKKWVVLCLLINLCQCTL